jgi:hypothetical protein
MNNSNRKSKTIKKTLKRNKNMRGGNNGRYVLPPSYFGSGSKGYYQEGSSELANNKHSVSQGTIWSNGEYAGPNLYPSMTGGGCGCNGSRKKKSKKSKKSNSRKSKKSKSKNNKKH